MPNSQNSVDVDFRILLKDDDSQKIHQLIDAIKKRVQSVTSVGYDDLIEDLNTLLTLFQEKVTHYEALVKEHQQSGESAQQSLKSAKKTLDTYKDSVLEIIGHLSHLGDIDALELLPEKDTLNNQIQDLREQLDALNADGEPLIAGESRAELETKLALLERMLNAYHRFGGVGFSQSSINSLDVNPRNDKKNAQLNVGSLPETPAELSADTSTEETHEAGEDTFNTLENLKLHLFELRKAWADTQGQINSGVDGVLDASFKALDENIIGLIDGTKDWGTVFNSVGEAVIKQLAKIALQQLLMSAISSAEHKKQMAEESAKTGPLAANAMLKSISTTGVSALLGMAAFTAAMAAAGSFASGGYTGHGRRLEPAGIVHRGEYVFDAQSTRRIGLANLEALRLNLPPFDFGGPVSLPAPQALPTPQVHIDNHTPPVNIGVYSNPDSTRDFLESREGKKVFLDLMREHQWRV